MSYFPPVGQYTAGTGTISGNNLVDCPCECKLSQNSPIVNKNDYGTRNNVYDLNDISGYYCAVNSGPPIQHTTRPDGYTSRVFYVSSYNWADSFSAGEINENEMYTDPKSDYLYSVYNSSATCTPGTTYSGDGSGDDEDPPLQPHTWPRPPKGINTCGTPQSSLSWFRLRN